MVTTSSHTTLPAYNCGYHFITHNTHSIQLWLPLHHTQHSQRTAVVTTSSHTTLPAYNCGYLPITHNTPSIQLWLPVHCTHHVMSCYVRISLETPQCTTIATLASLLKVPVHNHGLAHIPRETFSTQTQLCTDTARANHGFVHTLLIPPAHITTIAIYTSTHTSPRNPIFNGICFDDSFLTT